MPRGPEEQYSADDISRIIKCLTVEGLLSVIKTKKLFGNNIDDNLHQAAFHALVTLANHGNKRAQDILEWLWSYLESMEEEARNEPTEQSNTKEKSACNDAGDQNGGDEIAKKQSAISSGFVAQTVPELVLINQTVIQLDLRDKEYQEAMEYINTLLDCEKSAEIIQVPWMFKEDPDISTDLAQQLPEEKLTGVSFFGAHAVPISG